MRPRGEVFTANVAIDLDERDLSSEEDDEYELSEGDSDPVLATVENGDERRLDSEDEDSDIPPSPVAKEKKKIRLSWKSTKFCKVCKAKDHQAGFVGSVYLDCPNKPCYLCKRPGHTTATCPHKLSTEHGVTPAIRKSTVGLADYVHERQLGRHVALVRPKTPLPYKLDCGILKIHSRRVTYLEFHPTKDNILVSGDKKGQVAVWDYENVYEKTIYESIHSCIVNSMRFVPENDNCIYSSGSDGTVCLTDFEAASGSEVLLHLNPHGFQSPSTWRMIYGMDINPCRHLVLAADNAGLLYQLDSRTKKQVSEPILIHKKGTKVVSLHTNPVDPDVFITAGNDYKARIWDTRKLKSEKELAELSHPKVVNSAFFSPVTGNKILTTCQDNRIRVWDCIFSNLATPSREIVHSQNFNRHITAFRAEWDPKDSNESLIAIGRYISDDYDGVALHPIDLIDACTGQLVMELVDQRITTISPVNKFHPRVDLLATGSSRSLFVWRPEEELDRVDEEKKQRAQDKTRFYNMETGASKKRKGGKGGDDEGEVECLFGGKMKQKKR